VTEPATTGNAKARARFASVRSLPRAASGLFGAAVITGTVAYFLPRLFSATSSAGPPVKTNVVFGGQTSLAMVLPQASLRGGPGAGCEAFREWGLRVGGVDAGESVVSVVVQGNTSDAVYVAGMRAHVLSEGTPAEGVLGVCPSAGTVTPRDVVLDLDASRTGKYVTSGRAAPFGFTLARGETEVFHVTATTRRHAVRWLLELDLVVAGAHRTIVVSEDGRPFATSAYAETLPRYVFEEGTWHPSHSAITALPASPG
jgi:hypothetical protein